MARGKPSCELLEALAISMRFRDHVYGRVVRSLFKELSLLDIVVDMAHQGMFNAVNGT